MKTWRYGERLRAAREARGGACQVCGGCRKLEFAHRRPTGLSGRGRGLRQRALDVERNPEAYVLLCRSCHKAFDLGHQRVVEKVGLLA